MKGIWSKYFSKPLVRIGYISKGEGASSVYFGFQHFQHFCMHFCMLFFLFLFFFFFIIFVSSTVILGRFIFLKETQVLKHRVILGALQYLRHICMGLVHRTQDLQKDTSLMWCWDISHGQDSLKVSVMPLGSYWNPVFGVKGKRHEGWEAWPGNMRGLNGCCSFLF